MAALLRGARSAARPHGQVVLPSPSRRYPQLDVVSFEAARGRANGARAVDHRSRRDQRSSRRRRTCRAAHFNRRTPQSSTTTRRDASPNPRRPISTSRHRRQQQRSDHRSRSLRIRHADQRGRLFADVVAEKCGRRRELRDVAVQGRFTTVSATNRQSESHLSRSGSPRSVPRRAFHEGHRRRGVLLGPTAFPAF